jgi:cytochrome c2
MLVAQDGAAQDGAAIYKERCASCHDAADGRAPKLDELKAMTGEAIFVSLATGLMKTQAEGLSTQQIFALLGFIAPTGSTQAAIPGQERSCKGNAALHDKPHPAVTAIPGVVFSGAMDGHLRAYSTATGDVVWDVDTAQEFATVNGDAARGGAMDAGGPAVVNGMVFVNSGSSFMHGNVLLAFSVQGK